MISETKERKKLSIVIKDNLIEDQIKKFRKVLISSKRLRVE